MTARTSLTPHAAGMRDADPEGHHRRAKQAWHETGTLVLFAADIAEMDWQDRELINAIGAKRYGERSK